MPLLVHVLITTSYCQQVRACTVSYQESCRAAARCTGSIAAKFPVAHPRAAPDLQQPISLLRSRALRVRAEPHASRTRPAGRARRGAARKICTSRTTTTTHSSSRHTPAISPPSSSCSTIWACELSRALGSWTYYCSRFLSSLVVSALSALASSTPRPQQ